MKAKSTRRGILNPNKGLTKEKKAALMLDGDFSFAHNDGNEDLLSAANIGGIAWDGGWDIANMFRYSLAAMTTSLHIKHYDNTVRVLDVGASSATFVSFWYTAFSKAYKPHLHYLGLEVVPDVVEKGRVVLDGFNKKGASLNLQCHNLELQRLPNDFHPHIILAQEVIEHISKEAAAQLLLNAYNVLVPGGLLFLTTPNPKKPTQEFVWPESHVYEYSLDELLELTTEVGFETKAVNGWFGQQEDRKNATQNVKELYKNLSKLGAPIANAVIAHLYPQHAKCVCLTLKKPGKMAKKEGYEQRQFK